MNFLVSRGEFVSLIVPLEPILKTPSVTLDNIRSACGNINQIRMILKGDHDLWEILFKQAIEEKDAIIQIQLAHAYAGMMWGEDNLEDFSSIVITDLLQFTYYPKKFELLINAYSRVKNSSLNLSALAETTFRTASNAGYLPAFLELTHKEWEGRTESFGFAVQLRPFMGKDQTLDILLGKALKMGCAIGSTFFYQGLKLLNQSSSLNILSPEYWESFLDFANNYDPYGPKTKRFFLEALYHVGNVTILAPTNTAWTCYVKNKLDKTNFSPLDDFVFNYNSVEIKSLVEKYQLVISTKIDFKVQQDKYCSLTVSEGDTLLGIISLDQETFKIRDSFKDPRIQLLINFLENVMVRSNAQSACDWLKQIIQTEY